MERPKPLFLRFIQFLQRRRLPISALFFADPSFTKPLPVETYPFNRFGRCYEVCEWSPSSFNGQPTRCVGVIEEHGMQREGAADQPYLARFDFYAAMASHYYAPLALGIWCANWEMGCAALGIQGHFAMLTAAERGIQDTDARSPLPRYDVSWLLDENV